MRADLTPHTPVGRVLEVPGNGGTHICAYVLLESILNYMVECAQREKSIRAADPDPYVALVIASDATQFQKASSTRCDMFLDIWGDEGAHHVGRAWASWWVFDRGDDTPHLQRMAAIGRLNHQIKEVQNTFTVEINQQPKKLLAFKTGDGKVMMSAICGKCWNCNVPYAQFQTCLRLMPDFPPLSRNGALYGCVPPDTQIGDVVHRAARVATGIGKRTRKDASMHGGAAALKEVSHFFSHVPQGAKKKYQLPSVCCMRPPSKEKEHTIDINGASLFIETPELHAQLVAIVQRHCHLTVRWEGRQDVYVHVVLRMMLQPLWRMHRVWRFVGRVPMATCM